MSAADRTFDRLCSLFKDYVVDGFAGEYEAVASDRSEPGADSGAGAHTAAGADSGAGVHTTRRADSGAGVHAAAGADSDGESLDPQARRRELDKLAEQIRECSKCPLSAVRMNAVPAEGSLDALVMVIGEGPGADEDRSGRPFVGRAGRYLDKWLDAIGVSRDRNAFIANIVKCRPPQNRDPLPDERAACFPYLERQIELVRPKSILTVGRVSSRVITGVDASMAELRKGEHMFRGIPVFATYHPSAVLRNDALRRPVWEDLKRLRSAFSGEA